MRIYIGCSGYYYREWKGQFYPADIPSTKWLAYYAQHFNTIEINSTFYRMPTPKSLAKWYKDTPEDFLFTVKANKLFTHFKKMQGIEAEQKDFYDTIFTSLGEKLMCVLYQFPASFKFSPERLDAILGLGSLPVPHVIEFRDISWWQEAVYRQLHSAGLHFCNISLPDFPDLYVPDRQLNYLRFHGKPVLYKSGYGEEGLEWWAREVQQQPAEQLIVYFNNTWYGEAIPDAKLFGSLL